MPTVKPLTEQDLREHKMLARIEALESEVAHLEWMLNEVTAEHADPLDQYLTSVH